MSLRGGPYWRLPWQPGSRPASLPSLALALPRMADTLWQRFSDPYGDHPPYSAVRFRVEPGDLSVVYGQGVEIRAIVEGAPVDRLDLVLEPAGAAPERVPMFQEASGRWRAALANVIAPARYFVSAQAAGSKLASQDRRHHRAAAQWRPLPRHPAGIHAPVCLRRCAARRRAGGVGRHPCRGLGHQQPPALVRNARARRRLRSTHTRARPDRPGRAGSPRLLRDSGRRQDRDPGARLDGQQSQDALSASVVLLHDERPFIRITEPRELSFATPDVLLPVVLAAEDDFGIARVQLFRALNGSRALPIDLPLGSGSPTQWNDQTYLPLAEYGVRPGDEITLFARVEDNDPAGAKGSESTVVRLRIIPREVYDRLIRARQGAEALLARYQEAQRRLEALAGEIDRLHDELAKLPTGTTLEQAKQKQLEELARRFRDETAAIRESAKHPLPVDIDQNLSHELEDLAEALEKLAQEAEKLAAAVRAQECGGRAAPRRAARSPDRRSQAARAKCPGAARSTGESLSTHGRSGSVRAALPPPARSGTAAHVVQGTRSRR